MAPPGNTPMALPANRRSPPDAPATSLGPREAGERPSCTLQPGATGPGVANSAGASGLMQIGIGAASGDTYQHLQPYLSNPQLGPHDPTTAVQLAALTLLELKGAPRDAPIPAYLPYVTAYNGTGPAAVASGQRVIADAQSYQGNGTTGVAGECQQRPTASPTRSPATPTS
jgi:hypothetical protein